MSNELVALLMLGGMLVLLFTGQRVFGAIGFVAAAAAVGLYGTGGNQMPFNAAMTVLNWYPLVTLPMFIYMGYMLSESGISGDLYRMFHVWAGPLRGGLGMGTIGVMLAVSAMNGLSVAGMAIGASIALPEMLRRGYDPAVAAGTICASGTLGQIIPPSIILVLLGQVVSAAHQQAQRAQEMEELQFTLGKIGSGMEVDESEVELLKKYPKYWAALDPDTDASIEQVDLRFDGQVITREQSPG